MCSLPCPHLLPNLSINEEELWRVLGYATQKILLTETLQTQGKTKALNSYPDMNTRSTQKFRHKTVMQLLTESTLVLIKKTFWLHNGKRNFTSTNSWALNDFTELLENSLPIEFAWQPAFTSGRAFGGTCWLRARAKFLWCGHEQKLSRGEGHRRAQSSHSSKWIYICKAPEEMN